MIPEAWHEQADFENQVSYAQGYEAGYAQAVTDIAQEVCSALGRSPADPPAVVAWLVRTVDSPRSWAAQGLRVLEGEKPRGPLTIDAERMAA